MQRSATASPIGTCAGCWTSTASCVTDVEAVGDWLGPPPEDQPTFLHHVYPVETYLDVAAALGARTVVAVHFGAPAPVDLAAERFAVLCDAAADRDLQVALEFPAFATISDVATAWDVVRLADRPNAGILVDLWHHRRGGNDEDALRAIDGSRVLLRPAVRRRRRPCRAAARGRDAPVACPATANSESSSTSARSTTLGVRAPIGIEVFDEALLARGPRAAAERLVASLRHVVAEALRESVQSVTGNREHGSGGRTCG